MIFSGWRKLHSSQDLLWKFRDRGKFEWLRLRLELDPEKHQDAYRLAGAAGLLD
jgi:hypothetical protein